MYKNIILSYVNNLTKNDLYSFRNNNSINATDQDIDIVYESLKKYRNDFFNDPNKYIEIVKSKVSENCAIEIDKYYNKYKKVLEK